MRCRPWVDCFRLVHFLLCVLGASTGMMEIRPWGGQHKHKHPEGLYPRFVEKGKRGPNGHRQEASGYHQKFPDPRITAASALHDVGLVETAAKGQRDPKISSRCNPIRWPLKFLGKSSIHRPCIRGSFAALNFEWAAQARPIITWVDSPIIHRFMGFIKDAGSPMEALLDHFIMS